MVDVGSVVGQLRREAFIVEGVGLRNRSEMKDCGRVTNNDEQSQALQGGLGGRWGLGRMT